MYGNSDNIWKWRGRIGPLQISLRLERFNYPKSKRWTFCPSFVLDHKSAQK